jgi:photosystem II stability/assembly factor-like uncharacterized protein
MADRTYIYAGSEAGVLYRKEASADHWDQLTGNGLPPKPEARAIVVHPQNPDLVYVGTQRGLYLSGDRGDQWKRAALPEGRTVWSIAFRPGEPRVMYLGTQGDEVFRSDDGGESWNYLSTIVNPEAISMFFPTRILGLALEASDPDKIFAAMEVGGVARSLDGGKAWKLVNGPFLGDADLLDMHSVAVGSPTSDAAFISNRTGVWRSRDRGETWENTHVERFSPIRYSRGVRVAPDDPNTIYACIGLDFGSGEGGIMRSADLGETWERFDVATTPASTTFGMSIDAQHPEKVYFCTRRGQVFGTEDGGATWSEHPLPDDARDVISVACTSV